MTAVPLPSTPPDPTPWSCTVSGLSWADVCTLLDQWEALNLTTSTEHNQFSTARDAARTLFDQGHHPAQPATVTISGFHDDASAHLGVVVSG